MAKIKWRGGALTAPVPPVMVSCGNMEDSNIITVAWTGIINTVPPKTYISVRPSRHSYSLIKESGEFVVNLTTAEMIKKADFVLSQGNRPQLPPPCQIRILQTYPP